MKLVAVFLAVALVACCSARVYYPQGFNHVPYGVATPYRNDLRQVAVNNVAEYVGASSGTARYDGVPGAGRYVFDNRYGYGGYGYPTYGYYGYW